MPDENASVALEDAPRRFPEVDILKVAGIVSVVLIHSLRPHFHPRISWQENWLLEVLRFAVPTFLAVSGFLYATARPIPWSQTVRRLRRILIPYLFASVAAEIFWWALGGGPQTGSVSTDLLFAAAFGPYYYVFLIALFVLLAPSLAHVPERALPALILLCVAAQGLLENGIGRPLDLLWVLRNPLLWAAYFLAGWWLRIHYATLVPRLVQRRAAWALALAVAVAGLSALPAAGLWPAARPTAGWLQVWAIMSLLFVLTCGRERSPAPVRALSDATYAIYLFHLFFVLPTQAFLPATPDAFELVPILLPWLAGMLGSGAVIGIARVLLGRRARDLIGA